MDLGFLKTRQKNTNIQFSNYDFTHSNQYTSKLGEMLVTQKTKVIPNDKIKHRVNEETLCQQMENPSFTKFKHVHKSFYYPNTVLWKYWDNFFTNKPDDLWTNSDITSYINERQPYSIPKCYFKDLLPYIAIAQGHFADMRMHSYLPQMPIIYRIFDDNNMISSLSPATVQFMQDNWPPYVPTNGLNVEDSYKYSCTSAAGSPICSKDSNDHVFESQFYDALGVFSDPLNVSSFGGLAFVIMMSSLDSDTKTLLNSYLDVNNFRYYVTFKITSVNFLNVIGSAIAHTFNNTYSTIGQIYDYSTPYITDNPSDFKALRCPDFGDPNGLMSPLWAIWSSYVTENNTVFHIPNVYSDNDVETYCLPVPTALESTSFGFSPMGFFFYQCRNIAKHLDMMGINAPIDFYHFTEPELFKPINLLPFIAYNRFYHEEIADKQRQVNCPSWHYANGLIALYHNTKQSQESSLEKYQSLGWTLHFDDIPYNKVHNLVDLKIVTYNPFSASLLLTGFDINLLTTNQSFMNKSSVNSFYQSQQGASTFLEPVFQSYNGLLHLQYANFAPDYFNQSVMDPLAGAQDIQIPSTITQLQEKSKLQELLNQTAWTRNIKEFLQSQFDAFSRYTTIDDAVITGSCDVDVNISQVLQTSESDNTPLGTRAGVGSAYGNGYLCENEFHEFGWYMTVSYFVMDSIYINRLDKQMVAESNYLELPFPQLANLGNEAIEYSEINFGRHETVVGSNLTPLKVAPFVHNYAAVFEDNDSNLTSKPVGTSPRYPHTNKSLDNTPLPELLGDGSQIPSNINFGYIPRYSSYKFKFNEVHGDFLKSLRNWVATRDMTVYPLQNYTFISYECQALLSNLMKNFVDRLEENSDAFLTNALNIMEVRRCLPFVVNPSF